MKHINNIIGIAALAISAGFSSCSHDLGDWTPTDEVNDTYNRMFVETFGQPAANHNWGFDQQTRAAGSRITRSQTTPACRGVDDGTLRRGMGDNLQPDGPRA